MRLERKATAAVAVSLLISTFGPAGISSVERAAAAGGFVCGAYDQTAERGRTPTPDANGRIFPIVTIHGITGSDNDFDRTIDKSYGEANPQPPRSLLDALAGPKVAGQTLPPGLPGVHVYSFSYTPDSLRWVDNPAVGGKFAATIDCLYAMYHAPVSVIAHSMGGLVTRWVANTRDAQGVSRATKLGKVITLGTPYEGSFMSAIANGATDALGVSVSAIALLNYLCGASGTATGNGSCGPIPLYAAFRSEAGRDQRTGAKAIKELKRWPAGVDVETIAGSERIPLALFGSPLNASVDYGDLAVTPGSATADPRVGRVFSCRYDSASGTASTILKQILRLASPDERHAKLTGAFLASPCYHSNLMRNVELTNEILGALSDWLASHRAVSQTLPPISSDPQSAAALQALLAKAGISGEVLPAEQCAGVDVAGANFATGDADLTINHASALGCQAASFATIYIIRSGTVTKHSDVCDCGDQTPLTLDFWKRYTRVNKAATFHADLSQRIVPGGWVLSVPVVIAVNGDDELYKPADLLYTGDGTGQLSDLKWTSWSASGAVGTGTDHVTDCTPDCAGGTPRTYPATVRLSGATQTEAQCGTSSTCSYFLFTRMVIDAPTEPGGGHSYTIPR